MRHRKSPAKRKGSSKQPRMVAIDKYDTEPCDSIHVKDWKMDPATFTAFRMCVSQARDASLVHLQHAELTNTMVQQLAVALADPECSVKHVVLEFNPLVASIPAEECAEDDSSAAGGAGSAPLAAADAAAPAEDLHQDSKHAEEPAATQQQESKGGEDMSHEAESYMTPPAPHMDPAEAAATFALLLHPDIGLKSLSLRGCGLQGDKAALALAAALLQNGTLETLVLSENALGDEGLSLLAHAVRDCPAPLCELDVGGVSAGAEGALAIAAAAAPWALTEDEVQQRSSVFEAVERANEAWSAACEAHGEGGSSAKGGKGGKSKSTPKGGDKKKGKGSASDVPPALVPWFVRDVQSLSAAHRSAVDIAVSALLESGEMPVAPPESLPPSMLDAGASKSLKGGKGGAKGGKAATDAAVTDDTPGVKLWLTHAKGTLRGLNVSRNALGARGVQALRATLVPDQLLSLVGARAASPRPSSAAGSELGAGGGADSGRGSARGGKERSGSRSGRSSSPKSSARRGSSPKAGRSRAASTAAPVGGGDGDQQPPPLAATTVSGVRAVWAQSVLGQDHHLYSVFVPEGMEGGYLSAADVKAWWGEAAQEPSAGGAGPAHVSANRKLALQSALYTDEVNAVLQQERAKAEKGGLTLLL